MSCPASCSCSFTFCISYREFLVLQLAFLKVLSEDLDVSSQGEDSSRISNDIEKIMSQLAAKEKELQYALKNKKT
jgi:hypothetical protein